MKRTALILGLMLATAAAQAQNVARRQSGVHAAGRYQVTSLAGLNIYAHNLSWNTSGTVNACTIRLQQASALPNWNDLDATYSCISSGVGAVVALATAVNNVSVQVVTFSGSGSISFLYQGWMVSPSVIGGASPLTTKGDIWGYSTTNARIPVGANGLFLKADSTQPLGVVWAAAGAGTITGSGTVNTLPKFTAATAIGDTQINEAGGIVTVTNEDFNVTRVGAGATTVPAVEMINSTAATLATPVQAGPYLSTCGSAWDTDGLVADTHCWRALALPASATSTSSSLLFESFKTGGAYTSRFALPSSGFTAGSVPFIGSDGFTLSQDNANLSWTGVGAAQLLSIGDLEGTFDAGADTIFGGNLVQIGNNAARSAPAALAVQTEAGTIAVDGSSATDTLDGGATGIRSRAVGYGSNNLTALTGIVARVTHNSTGTAGTITGINIQGGIKGGGAGVITDNIGLNIGDETVGSNNYAIKTGTGLNDFGDTVKAPRYATTTNCADSAGAAACGSAAAGAFVIDATTTSTVVSTTAVTANSRIFLQEDSSLSTELGVTCNTQSSLVLGALRVTARTAATSFTATLEAGPTTNPMCVSYWIVN